MGVSTRKPWLTSLGVVLAGVTLCAGVARAELALSTDTPGSIAVFPKVIADEARDTIIMLTNTSNMPLSVHCWYFDANNACQPADFYVDLTSRQPTWWRVSTGRDSVDEPNVFHGSVPARVNFQGELKCVEIEGVNLSPFPVVRNALKGEATLVTKSDGQTSAYNAIMFQGGDGAVSLCQGGARDGLSCDPRDQNSCCAANDLNCGVPCRTQLLLDGTHYAHCPDNVQVTHYSQGAPDFINGSTVTGELTLVPCTENMNDFPTDENSPKVVAQLRVVNEFEQGDLSASIPFTCWANVSLGDEAALGTIYEADFVGPWVKTRIETQNKDNAGLLGVFEEFHTPASDPCTGTSEPCPPTESGTAAVNFHGVGSRTNTDVITIEDLQQ